MSRIFACEKYKEDAMIMVHKVFIVAEVVGNSYCYGCKKKISKGESAFILVQKRDRWSLSDEPIMVGLYCRECKEERQLGNE